MRRGGYNREICLGKVYFNARFDDVMLIVKREMASVLRGPLPATLSGCTMFICFMFPYRDDYTGVSRPGKAGFGYVCFSGVLSVSFISSRGAGLYVC